MGLGPDLAIGIRDISQEGTFLIVKESIAPKSEIEIALTAVGISKPIVVMGQVVRCTPIETGFLIGVKFRDRLAYTDFCHLT